MPLITSELPRVVKEVDPTWQASLKSDSSYYFYAQENKNSGLFDLREPSLTGPCLFDPNECQEELLLETLDTDFWDLLREVETDARTRGLVDSETAVEHQITIRTGTANAASYMQLIPSELLRIHPGRLLLPSVTHCDIGDPPTELFRRPFYTLVHGKGTRFYNGKFLVLRPVPQEKIESRSFAHSVAYSAVTWFGLRAQALLRKEYAANSDELLQADTLTVHRMPGVKLDPADARVFFRDVLVKPKL